MLSFPFSELRPGQDEIISSVRSAIEDGEKLFIQAPTGMGKTAAVLYGAIDAVKDNDCRIVFLTAKHTHQNIVYETLKKIKKSSGIDMVFTGVNGKRSMCLFENSVEPALFIEFCRAVREQGLCDFYKNTFTRSKDVKAAAMEAMSRDISDPASIIEVSKELELCPYEISLLNARRSKVIVANYSHMFDPDISYGFIAKTGLNLTKTIVIVDEAHNLPGKIVDANSFSISLRTLERAYNEATLSGERGIAEKIDRIMSDIKDVKTEKLQNVSDIFSHSDADTIDAITKQHEKGYNIPASFTLKKFVSFVLKLDESHLQYASNDGGYVKLNLFALDPSRYSSELINAFRSCIMISGTLKPLDMFAKLLGVPESRRLVLEDGVAADNRLLINETDTTSKFANRGDQYSMIAKRIDELLENFKHNMIIFFPSYSFMDSVFALISKKDGIIKEQPKIDRDKKSAILSALSRPGSTLFAVIGGNFSESIGLNNNIIRLVAIVGVPFEPPSIRLKAMQEYYEKKFGNGFEYAQALPSMIKTMQAAGRAIRSGRDKAVVLLMDSRYSSGVFTKYLPAGIRTIDGSPLKIINEAGFN